MYRFSRIVNTTATTFMLLGAFLMVFYVCTDFNEYEPKYIEEVVRIEDNLTVYPLPRCQRNTDAAHIPGFSSLPLHIQDFLYYRHCRHFQMILDVPDKCRGVKGPKEVFLLLVIKSLPINYERREVLRKTWAKERLHKGKWIRRVFLSGTSSDKFDKKGMNQLLKLEQEKHNDILQWDFNESLFNLTLKQMLFLEWMEKNCPHARFLLNGDDDVLANTDNMIEYLEDLSDNDGGKHLFTGHVITNAGPIRFAGSKYFIPVQVYQADFYPPYCGGGGYLLSGHTALVIYRISDFIPLFPIDDVYMGMCLAKANLLPVSHEGVRTLEIATLDEMKKYDPCIMKELLLLHNFVPAHIYMVWYQIHDPNLKCGIHKRIEVEPTNQTGLQKSYSNY